MSSPITSPKQSLTWKKTAKSLRPPEHRPYERLLPQPAGRPASQRQVASQFAALGPQQPANLSASRRRDAHSDVDSQPGQWPDAQHPTQVRALAANGIGCGVLMAPVIPFLSDHPPQLGATVRAIAAAGATSVTPLVLHLPRAPGSGSWPG